MTSSFPGAEPAPGLVVSTLLRTAAGSPLPVEVTLTNNASDPRVLVVGALGVDSAWLPPQTRTAPLEPGQSIIVTLTLSPTLGTVPGQYPFAFTVQALDPVTGRPAGSAAVMVDSALVVNPRNQLTLELRPRSATTVSSRKVLLLLRNNGTEPARVNLAVQTSPRVRVSFRKKVIEVLPGATEQVRGRATVTHRRLFGGVDNHTYTVSASGTESLRHVEGSVSQRPLVGTMLMKAVALASVLAIWIGAAVIFIPQLANRIGDRSSETSSSTTADGSTDGGSKDSGKAGGEDSGDQGSGGGDSGADGGGSGGGGGAQPAAATPDDEIALTGTVAGDAPAGVRVSLEPTSLVDEDAQGGLGVGVPSSQLGNTGMSLASSFLNRALPKTPPNRTATTTADGSWAFAGVKKPGYYLVTFSKPGFQKQSFVVDSTSEASTVPLEVDLAAGEGTLSGNVTGPRGKVGAASVTITDGTNTITTSTNSRGRVGHWSVKGLSTPGAYVVQVSKPGLSSESRMVDLGAGGTATADLTLRNGVASLVGRVRSINESGAMAGLGGATVTVASEDGDVRTATTLTQGERAERGGARVAADFVGSYTVPGLPVPGTYVVTLSGPGMQTQTSTVTFKRGQSRASTDADLVPSSGSVAGTISGLTTDGDSRGIVGAGMTLASDENTYKTMSTSEPTGSFLFAGVAPGTYSLESKYFSYVTDHVTITVRAGRTTTINREIKQVEGGVLAARSSVQGRAIDGSTNLAVSCPAATPACLVATVVEPGVDEKDTDDKRYTTTFLPGDQFRLPDPLVDPDGGLLPGIHTVSVSAPHYSSASAKIRVGNNEVANIGTLTLLPAPKIVGTITTAVGTPEGKNTCVWAVPLDGAVPPLGCNTATPPAACQRTPATFDGSGTGAVCAYIEGGTGNYSIEVPKEGTYTVYVRSDNREYVSPEPADILLEAGVTRNQSFVLNRLGRINVTVRKTGPTGALMPFVGTVVGPTPGVGTADVATPDPADAETDVNGTMQFRRVKPGTYTLGVSVGGVATTVSVPVGLNLEVPARINVTNPIDAAVGQVTSNMDGVATKVEQAKVSVTAPVGYGSDDSVNLGTVDMTTTDKGCFLIEKSTTESPSYGSGDCSWPAGPDVSRGRMTFVSPVASSIALSAPGYVSETKTNVTLSTGADLNSFTLAPKPVPLGSVTPVVDPEDDLFDWTKVAFTAVPLAGPTNAISVSATGTGDGTLVWGDTRVGTPNMVIPGTYRITATRDGYLDAQRTLDCPLAIDDATCTWDATEGDDDLTLTKRSSFEVKAVANGASVTGATYLLTGGGLTRSLTDTGGTGAVTFTGLDPRVDTGYRVEIRAAGYAFGDTSALPLTCTPAPTGGLRFSLEPGGTTSCEATLTKLGTISGKLTGVPGGKPTFDAVTDLTSAPVRIQQCDAINTAGSCTAVSGPVFPGTTGDDGRFSITGTAVDAGLDTGSDWLVTAAVTGYSLAAAPGALRGVVVRRSDFTLGAATADVTMYLDPVDVSVQLLAGTTAVTGASVELYKYTSTGSVPVKTAVPRGSAYDLTGIVPGRYFVQVSGAGLVSTTWDATIESQGQVISVPVARAVNVAYGNVTGSDLGPGALKDATVWVCADPCTEPAKGTDDARMKMDTPASGDFAIRTVPDGMFSVKIFKTGYRTQTVGPFDFNHGKGAVPPISVQLPAVERSVKITVKRPWNDTSLAGSSITLTGVGARAGATRSGTLAVDGTDLSATFNQVPWGCWSVLVSKPARHLGTPGALQGGPTDTNVTGCTGGDQITVPSADTTTAATASLTLNEGRVDVSVAATPYAGFGHATPGPVKLTIKQGATTVYTTTTFGVGAVTDIWLPTGASYVVSTDLTTSDPFWPPDQKTVAVPAAKPSGADAVPVALSLVERTAKLEVTVEGNITGDPQAALTLTGDVDVPPAYTSVVTTSGYKYTFTLPAGTWTVSADVAGRTKAGNVEIDDPDGPGAGGKYTLKLTVPAPPPPPTPTATPTPTASPTP